ncbi:MAG: galactose-1-phosphate uridylyltransferase [Candidatus Omnitrophica bacterium]|nr:galactose-1-phosphate uridylyltransferase [Candidatus Omnitrophota bacterium]
MSELRRDPITGRWNIVDTDEPAGPDAFEVESRTPGGGKCPFCLGHEGLTPPEIYVVRPNGGSPNGPGWQVRVVANKFPALRIEGELNRRGLGLFDLCTGVGAHEVIVETPDHQRQMADLSLVELEQVLRAFKTRSLDLRGDKRFKYTLLFKNFGLSAGASLEHAHSQLIALPIVPKRVQEQLNGAWKYFEFRERCAYCDMMAQELQERERIVCENERFLAYCPYVSNFPFEIQILPKEHGADFAQITPEEIRDFTRILKATLLRLRHVLSDPSYNFIIHTTPIEARHHDEYHWHVELIPKLTRIAGFEWGTGFYINPTPPELAATFLRDAKPPCDSTSF